MEKNQTILIVEGKEGNLFEGLREVQRERKIERVDFSEAPETLRHQTPRLVIFNLDHQKEEAKKILSSFSPALPETFWAISAEAMSTEELVDFVRLGASDYLRQPLQEKEWQDLLRRMDHLKTKKVVEPPHESHQLISFFSSKGGVGLSFLAVNLAVALAKESGGSVALADLVLQHGNLSDLLDVEPTFTVLDLTQNLERLDKKFLENSIPKHRSGVYLVARPKQPEESERLSGKEMEPVLEALKQAFNYVVLDTGHEFTTVTLACLDRSEVIFTVTTPDLPSLCNTKLAWQTFQKLGYSQDKVKLILNRWHRKEEIDISAIEKNISYPIYHRFPEDSALVLSSMNRGVPVCDLDKRSKLAQSFEELARQFVPVTPKET